MALEVRVVTTDRKGLALFRKFPWLLYKDDPVWAPELILADRDRFNKKKHPFYEFGDADFFLAFRDGKPVGRIAAIDNPRHREFQHENIGFWGFFECEDNQETANALFAAARAWNKAKGFELMRGPMSHDTQDEIGIVIEGHQHMRYFFMPHNPAYYQRLCESAGLTKEIDLLAFHLDPKAVIPDRVEKMADLVVERLAKRDIRVRSINRKSNATIVADIEKVLEVFNEGFKDEWGYVPATRRQFEETGTLIKLVVPKELALLIEGPKVEGSEERPVVAMAIAMYDVSEVTFAVRHLPYALQEIAQILNLAYRVYVKPYPKFTRGRLFYAGVMKTYRNQGIDSLLYVLPFREAKKIGISSAELSWEREHAAIISPIEKMGGVVYKKFRIYNAST